MTDNVANLSNPVFLVMFIGQHTFLEPELKTLCIEGNEHGVTLLFHRKSLYIC